MDAEWLCIGQKQCMRTFRWCFISLFRQKGYNTWCSQAVSHPSTNQALRCLTSVIGREPVHSTWYGRSHWYLKQKCSCTWELIHTTLLHTSCNILSFLQMHFDDDFPEASWSSFRALGSRPLSQSALSKRSCYQYVNNLMITTYS